MLLQGLGNDVDALGHLVRILEVQRAADEVVLHHQHRIDNLRSASHPHLVSGKTLRRGDGHAVVAEHLRDGLCLTTVADGCRGGMGVHVSDVLDAHAGTLQAALQRTGGTFHIGCRDMVAVA